MRLLVFSALVALASAQCKDAKPCNGYWWGKVVFGISGAECKAAENVRATLVKYIPVEDAQIPKGTCMAANKTTTFAFTVHNLDGKNKGKVSDLQTNSKMFTDWLRKKESFDSLNVNVTLTMNSNVLCNGGSVWYKNMEFKKMTDKMINKMNYYMMGKAVIFYSKDGKWMHQTEKNVLTDATMMVSCMKDLGPKDCKIYQDLVQEKSKKVMKLEAELKKCMGGMTKCEDNLRTPILVEKDWWYCDELTFADCTDKTHGTAVKGHCPGLCNTCNKGKGPVCEERYHTKVLVQDVGSLYCDQLYPEECNKRGVAKTCCHTCDQ